MLFIGTGDLQKVKTDPDYGGTKEMIREVKKDDIPGCVDIIKKSFKTVADEFGFTEEMLRGSLRLQLLKAGFSGRWKMSPALCFYMRMMAFRAAIIHC